MIPTFENNSRHLTLVCPYCEFPAMHQVKTDIYERREDDLEGLHVSVGKFYANMNKKLDGNPSPRRQGLTIEFECEGCENKPVLKIYQHKGQTFIEF